MTSTRTMQLRARARRRREPRKYPRAANINHHNDQFQRDLEYLANKMGMDIGQKRKDGRVL